MYELILIAYIHFFPDLIFSEYFQNQIYIAKNKIRTWYTD